MRHNFGIQLESAMRSKEIGNVKLAKMLSLTPNYVRSFISGVVYAPGYTVIKRLQRIFRYHDGFQEVSRDVIKDRIEYNPDYVEISLRSDYTKIKGGKRRKL